MATITVDVTGALGDDKGLRCAAAVSLVYDDADPLAVTLHVADIRWTFSRDLLALGLQQPAGMGDVKVVSTQRVVQITLTGPGAATGETNRAVVHIARPMVEGFVGRVYAAVPHMCEPALDSAVDDAIAAIFAEAES